MASLTDPARELGEIAQRLTAPASEPGEKYLAAQFGVPVWSTEFVKIIACILERADLVIRIINAADLDDDHKQNAINDLTQFKAGFTGPALRKNWNDAGHGLGAMKDHGRPIQYLSPTVRLAVSYPKLTDEEIAEFVGLIDAYLVEIETGGDELLFTRQAITDGLTLFKFQLERIGWMGSGYALAAFREVMIAYEASRRGLVDAGNPDAEAVLSGLRRIVSRFRATVDRAKGWADAGETIWKGYQIASAVATPLLLASGLPKLPG